MTSQTPLSRTSRNLSGSPISDLMQRALADPELISLAAGFVDNASLPVEAVHRAAAALLADPVEGRRALQYGTTIGDPAFRARLVARLEQEEGVPVGAFDHVLPRTVVTSGSQQLLYLLAEILLDPGDIVLVEAPTYFVFMGLLQARGVEVVGVETDHGGLRLDALEETFAELESQGRLDRVKLLYTISEHSNPTGLSLAPDRRGPLVDRVNHWSKYHQIYILEDAAYRGLSFGGSAEPPSVWRHDVEGRSVVLARTFSKTFSPGLKTGFGVLPAPLVAPTLALKGNHDFGSNNFSQLLLDRAMASGDYDRQVERLRETYQAKRNILLAALQEHFGGFEGVSWTRPEGGLYVWLTVPEGLDTGPDGPLFGRCLDRGVLYVPGEYAFAEAPGFVPTRHIRLCYGVPTETELAEGVRRMAEALAECLDPVA
ncbi:PLP-dependent aminotransferase family protein [soil metagenome]